MDQYKAKRTGLVEKNLSYAQSCNREAGSSWV